MWKIFTEQWSSLDTWIVVVGALSGMACALLGNYLVLRRMSMMGDAISHAVLPGLAVAFLLTGSRDSLTMFVGACVVGVVTALLVHLINRSSRLDEGASMGVVFTSLFALGLILIRQAADHVDLDPGCVLYGAIELTPLDTYRVFGWDVPRAVMTNGAMLLVNVIFVGLFYKELKLSSFDPELATTLGINANVMHYALMTLVAATCVAAFESVGSIIVIAMLIVPGACAHLLTDRLSVMLGLSLVIGALSAGLGHAAALIVPAATGYAGASSAGMMGAVAGVIFFFVLLLAPRHGVLSRLAYQARLSFNILCDDVLALLYRFDELKRMAWQPEDGRAALPVASHPALTSPLIREALNAGASVDLSLRLMRWRGDLAAQDRGWRLTESGESKARRLVRSHRLWEDYLVRHVGLPPERVHARAEDLEHVTDGEIEARLDIETGHARMDPHGHVIPEKKEDENKTKAKS